MATVRSIRILVTELATPDDRFWPIVLKKSVGVRPPDRTENDVLVSARETGLTAKL